MTEKLKQDLLRLKNKYKKELDRVIYDIKDFEKCLDVPIEEKKKRLDEMKNGRLSAENLTKNYELKGNIERTIEKLDLLLYEYEL